MFQLSDDQREQQIQPWSEQLISQNHTTGNLAQNNWAIEYVIEASIEHTYKTHSYFI